MFVSTICHKQERFRKRFIHGLHTLDSFSLPLGIFHVSIKLETIKYKNNGIFCCSQKFLQKK